MTGPGTTRRRSRCLARRDERGSAGAVLVVGICLSICAVFYAAVVLIHWFTVARQAEQAAELSALSAVSAAVAGDDPCRAAAETARRNEVTVAACLVRGEGRQVVVEVTVSEGVTPRLAGAPALIRRTATAASS